MVVRMILIKSSSSKLFGGDTKHREVAGILECFDDCDDSAYFMTHKQYIILQYDEGTVFLADQIEAHGQDDSWTWKQRLTVLRDITLGMIELSKDLNLHPDTDGVAMRKDGSAFLICHGNARLLYNAPELYSSPEKLTSTANSYSFGMIFYEVLLLGNLLTSASPRLDTTIMRDVREGKRPDIPPFGACSKWIPSEEGFKRATHLVQGCWAEDPQRRMSMSDILNNVCGLLEIR